MMPRPPDPPFAASRVFTASRAAVLNRPDALVTLLGSYLSQTELLEAHGLLSYVETNGVAGVEGHTWQSIKRLRESVRWTRTIMALNAGRVWARKRLVERIGPLLEAGIALAVVPSHDPLCTDTPIRRIAQALAQESGRTDATGCLVRHTRIRRIVFGGKSTIRLHKETIYVQNEERVAGQRVLLLDDIRKSGWRSPEKVECWLSKNIL